MQNIVNLEQEIMVRERSLPQHAECCKVGTTDYVQGAVTATACRMFFTLLKNAVIEA
jgi:uncharacterized Fe-S radical SAM superfamily protein PflX